MLFNNTTIYDKNSRLHEADGRTNIDRHFFVSLAIVYFAGNVVGREQYRWRPFFSGQRCVSLSLSLSGFISFFFLSFCLVLFSFPSSSDDSSLVRDCYAFRLVKDDSIKNYAIEIQW